VVRKLMGFFVDWYKKKKILGFKKSIFPCTNFFFFFWRGGGLILYSMPPVA